MTWVQKGSSTRFSQGGLAPRDLTTFERERVGENKHDAERNGYVKGEKYVERDGHEWTWWPSVHANK